LDVAFYEWFKLMKIQTAQFIKSCQHLSDCPHDRIPEVAFVGRSNVGKSSLLNVLLHRKNLAKVSSSPGKTRLINFFRINEQFYLVDLPGYGFAKIPKTEQIKWKSFVEKYLIHRSNLKGVVHLVDARVGATEKDIAMKQWLEEYSKPYVLVATKVDKVSRGKRSVCFQDLNRTLLLPLHQGVVPFSSKTGEGLSPLWKKIFELLFSS